VHYKLTARRVILVRCGKIMLRVTRYTEEPVHLIPTWIFVGSSRGLRLRSWGLIRRSWNVCVSGCEGERVTLSIRRRYIELFFVFLSISFSDDVADEQATENEDNDASYSPANDCCDRCGRSGDTRLNLVLCISQK